MAAPVVESIETLLDVDPRALDDEALRDHVRVLARLQSRVQAAMLSTVSELDSRDAHLTDGSLDARGWLAHHTAMARKVAGATVWLAKRLKYMPLFATAMADGSITLEHARVMAQSVNPRTLELLARDEAMLVGHACELECDDFARVVTRWKLLADADGPDQKRAKPSELHVSPMLDGRHRIDGELDLEDSVEYTAELDRMYDEIWQADHADTATDEEHNRTRSQRYAAAQVEMARRSSAATDEGRSARKPLFIVTIDLDALAGNPAGRAELDDGTPVPPDLVQRWLCDSSISRVVLRGRSIPFDLGKVTYTASDGQRRVLAVRDGGCIVPGCKRKARWCQAHHVVFWPDGETNIDNLVLACHRHHRQVHQGTIKISPGEQAGTFVVTRADGTPLRQRPPPDLRVA